MKPLSLKLDRFLSYREAELDLSTIDCAVVAGPNGSGKSTLIVDAPMFALFGEARGGRLDSVVMRGEEVARVEYQFGLNGRVYLVHRQRSTKGAGSTTLSFLRLDENGEWQVLDGKTISETQKRIEEVTGLTADLLRATAVSSQGDASRFADDKPTDRKATLGQILRLPDYDRLAERARDDAKAAQADREAKDGARQRSEELAAQGPLIEAQIAEADGQISTLEAKRTEQSEAADALISEREQSVLAQAEDAAARKELRELSSRQSSLTADLDRAKVRVENLQQQVAGGPDTLQAIRKAEAAQTAAAEFEARRQERERLKGEAAVIVEQIRSRKASHGERIQSAEREVATAKREHGSRLTALREVLSALEEQAKPLDGVPCKKTPLAEKCPMIAAGMRAQAVLPSKQKELSDLEAQTPWAEYEQRLDALRGAEPWAADAAASARLKVAYDAIKYDAEQHAAAKAAATKLPDLQKSLAAIEAAQAQLPDAEHALDKAIQELDELQARAGDLADKLGPERDWPALLADIDRRLKAVKDLRDRFSRELDVGRQRLGSLNERLDAANKAAEQVNALQTEIAEIDRRITILKILGNPRDGAFSRGGIPALLIDQAVPELEAAANEVLATLSDGRMSLELRTQRENQSGSMSETLDLIVLDEVGEWLYEGFSGGERMRVDLALRVGLSKLLAHRADARCQLLVLDETCAPLDVRGREQFVEAVGKLAVAEDLTVLVVTHVDELKDSFPCQIVVTKDGDGSHVEVLR